MISQWCNVWCNDGVMAHSPVSSRSLSSSDQVEEVYPVSTDSVERSWEVLGELSPLACFRHMEGIRPCLMVSVFLGGQEGERREEGGKGRRRGGKFVKLLHGWNAQGWATCMCQWCALLPPPTAPPTWLATIHHQTVRPLAPSLPSPHWAHPPAVHDAAVTPPGSILEREEGERQMKLGFGICCFCLLLLLLFFSLGALFSFHFPLPKNNTYLDSLS